MPNLDRRAEINPLVESVTKRSGAHIPRWARVPASILVLVGGAGAVDQITNLVSTVEAIGKNCANTHLVLYSLGYANNPLIPNRPNQIDPVDIVIGDPYPGIAVVTYKENPKDPNSKEIEVGRQNMVPRGWYSDAAFDLSHLKSNVLGDQNSEAVQVSFHLEKDQPQVREAVVIRCGFTRPFTSGRLAPDSQIRVAIDNESYPLRMAGAVVDEAFKASSGILAGTTPKDISVDSKEVRRAWAEYLKKKAQTATPTVGAAGTPIPAGRGTETPTPTAIRPATSPTSTVTPEASPTATRGLETSTPTPPVASPEASPQPSPEASPSPTPETGNGIKLPDIGGLLAKVNLSSIKEGIGQSPVGAILDLPAKALDQVTENDVEGTARTGVNVAGWLLALGLLLNRPLKPRTRLWNTVAWPVRYPIYGTRRAQYDRAVAAGGAVGLTVPTPPARPFSA